MNNKIKVIVAIEGPIKSGKSIIANLIQKALQETGIETTIDNSEINDTFVQAIRQMPPEVANNIQISITVRTLVRFPVDAEEMN